MKAPMLLIAVIVGAALVPTITVASTGTAAQAPADMAQAEVRRVDKANGKITLRHGEIRNLDMPPMTMVFQVRDPKVLDLVKAGDAVRFRAVQDNGAYVVIDLQPAK